MKNITKKRLAIAAATLAIACATAAFCFTTAQDYSAADPLISKSYLDSVFFKQVTDYVDTKVASAPAAAAKTEYEVITLTKGQSLYAASSLEFILRPGSSAAVVSPVTANGIADLTNGSELYNGQNIPINSYCLIPRGDGRGIICTSDTAYIMVRGSYEIK